MKKGKGGKGIVFFFLLYLSIIGAMISYDRKEEGRETNLTLEKGQKLWDDFIYSIKWDLGHEEIEKKIVIHKYVGKERELVVPAEIEGISVEAVQGKNNLEKGGFVGKVKRVILPKGLKKIGDYAFAGSEVERIDIYSECEIGNYAFANCSNLKEVTYWDSERNTLPPCRYSSIMGEGAFLNCTALLQMDLPFGADDLPERFFEGCKSLEYIEIKDSFLLIGKGAFLGCTSLKEVWMNPNIRVIKEGAFEGCTELLTIVLPEDLQELEKGAFRDCTSLKKVQAPKNFEVDIEAFLGCTSLESIEPYDEPERGDGAEQKRF